MSHPKQKIRDKMSVSYILVFQRRKRTRRRKWKSWAVLLYSDFERIYTGKDDQSLIDFTFGKNISIKVKRDLRTSFKATSSLIHSSATNRGSLWKLSIFRLRMQKPLIQISVQCFRKCHWLDISRSIWENPVMCSILWLVYLIMLLCISRPLIFILIIESNITDRIKESF